MFVILNYAAEHLLQNITQRSINALPKPTAVVRTNEVIKLFDFVCGYFELQYLVCVGFKKR
jgi:hypothetical protein